MIRETMRKTWALVGLVVAGVLLLVAAGPATEPEGAPGNCYLVMNPDGDSQGGPDDSQDGECFETKAELYSAVGVPAPTDDPAQNGRMLQEARLPVQD